jgi:hypothetical protein
MTEKVTDRMLLILAFISIIAFIIIFIWFLFASGCEVVINEWIKAELILNVFSIPNYFTYMSYHKY